MKWTINNVWPRSWKIAELNAESGEVLIETLELNYNRLIFQTPLIMVEVRELDHQGYHFQGRTERWRNAGTG